jgi:hypothetical protein
MEQSGKRKKVDISSKVNGKLVDKNMLFYVDDREIGKMSMDNTEPRFHFEPDFGIEDNKIYQIQSVGVEDDQYVRGCDMGWC